jgi:hypothetical protein
MHTTFKNTLIILHTRFGHTCYHPQRRIMQKVRYKNFKNQFESVKYCFKMYGTKYMLKYIIQIQFFGLNLSNECSP